MKIYHLLPFMVLFGCQPSKPEPAQPSVAAPTSKGIGKIERLLPELDAIIDSTTQIEVLAEGYTWSEGPLWVSNGGYLLFTDVPENKIYKWKEGEGASLYLEPSGFTGKTTTSPERGGNGLALDNKGNLVLCQHGDRRVARMNAPLDKPAANFETVADKWNGQRFNSPNDLVLDKDGIVYFTDPPYGLKDHDKSKEKEIPFQGVYRRHLDGKIELIDASMTRPNGIALSPDGKTLIVANSDPDYAYWKAFDLLPDGTFANSRLFNDATTEAKQGLKGLPDGLKIRQDGTVFATGPGGVLVMNKDGVLLGRINPGEATANCALGADGYLYMTSDMYLCRVKLR